MAEPVYCTADDVRAEANLTVSDLSDAQALVLIQDAEDLLDEELGLWPVDPDTGRRIVQSRVLSWQWTKLSRCAAKLAARIYTEPDLPHEARYQHISGPDFSFSRPLSQSYGDDIEALLNQSGLRRMSTNSGRGTRYGQNPPWSNFQINDNSLAGDVEPDPYDPYLVRPF